MMSKLVSWQLPESIISLWQISGAPGSKSANHQSRHPAIGRNNIGYDMSSKIFLTREASKLGQLSLVSLIFLIILPLYRVTLHATIHETLSVGNKASLGTQRYLKHGNIRLLSVYYMLCWYIFIWHRLYKTLLGVLIDKSDIGAHIGIC